MTLENYITIAKTMGLMNCNVDIVVEAIDAIIDSYSFKYFERDILKMDANSLWLGLLPEEGIGIHSSYAVFLSLVGKYLKEMESGKNYHEAISEWFK